MRNGTFDFFLARLERMDGWRKGFLTSAEIGEALFGGRSSKQVSMLFENGSIQGVDMGRTPKRRLWVASKDEVLAFLRKRCEG